MCGLQRGSFDLAAKVKFNFEVFEMRLVIGARVKPDDLHEAGCKRIGREMQVSEQLSTKGTGRPSRIRREDKV
jgi:hypothetical protein